MIVPLLLPLLFVKFNFYFLCEMKNVLILHHGIVLFVMFVPNEF